MRMSLTVEGIREVGSRFAKAPQIVGEEITVANRQALFVTREEILKRTPVDTGNLRDHIRVRLAQVHGKIGGSVNVEKVPYARAQEFGAKPHVILPRHKSVLRFKVGGKTVFAKMVHHPGNPAVHYMRDGLRAAAPRVRAIFIRAGNRITRRLESG